MAEYLIPAAASILIAIIEIIAAEIDGVMTVTSWAAGVMPEPKPETPQMTTEEAILDKLTEIEYRQDLMELGLTEGGI